MLPFLFSANDRAGNRKRGNYAGDKSRMHLQNPSRKQHPSRVCGANCHAIFAKQNPTNAQSPTSRRNTFENSRSDSMKPTLLLNDEPEIVRLILEEVTSDGMAVRENEARAGCNCDRWGHPCSGCVDRDIVPKAETPVSSPVKQ
jgi:hypothetical protein